MSTAEALIAERPFLSFLVTQNDDLIQQLYESRHCVIALFRMLPQMAQQCLLHMMFRKSSDWRSWTNKRHHLAVFNSLQLLIKLRILEGDLDDKIQINLDFRMNYIASLLSDLPDISGLKSHPMEEKSRKAANKDLLGKSIERWESILCYLALPNDAADKNVSEVTRTLFKYIGLVRGNAKEPEISSTGFQFLLLSRSEQIWTYLIHYLRFMASKGEELFPVIEFFLRLTLNIQPHDSQVRPLVFSQDWPENVQAFMMSLREIGLVFIRKRKDGWFLLTPLMTQIAQEASGEFGHTGVTDASIANKVNRTSGFLIVETNYRVYAYTNSTLQLAILSTFSEILYRFHDITIGILSRDSVRRALQTGITARQISQYLRSNAHPQMHKGKSTDLIPVTVIDQIYLWEQERKRFTLNDGILYSAFDSEADYIAFRDFTTQQKFELWHCNIQKMIIVDAEGDERVRDWWNEYKQKGH